MTESHNDKESHYEGNEVAATKPPRHINWDAVAAIIAALIGLIAILVSAYTAWVTRQQTRGEVWPSLGIAQSGSLPAAYATNAVAADIILGKGGRIVVLNAGVGPAIVRRVEVDVNGKPQPDWRHVLSALGLQDMNYGQSTISHRSVRPGGRISILVIPDKEAWKSFRSRYADDVSIRICYCSTLGECWLIGAHKTRRHPQGQPVGSCNSISRKNEFQD